jgi:hypothetical protein
MRAVKPALVVAIAIALPTRVLAQRAPLTPEQVREIRKESESARAWPAGAFLIAAKAGVAMPVADVPAAFALGLEGGYRTSLLDRRLAIVAQLSWARPIISAQRSPPPSAWIASTPSQRPTLVPAAVSS